MVRPTAQAFPAALPGLPSGPGLFPLRILATSDLHGHLLPWDYYADRPAPFSGLSRTASLIEQAREEAKAASVTCLLVDNGDFLHGSPLCDVEVLHAADTARLHPVIAAMNALAYDAATLGNHEFSGGLGFLRSRIKFAAFPIVSANIAHRLAPSALADQTFLPPSVILTRKLTDAAGQSASLRIGLIGFLPPQTTQWDRQQLGGALVTRDILEAADAHVADLRRQGADIVLALAHTGIGPADHAPGLENAATALAALPGIDALIAGHTHQAFPGPGFAAQPGADPIRGTLQGKPAVMPGFHGSHLGLIDLLLAQEAGVWRLVGHNAGLRAVARRNSSGQLVPLIRRAEDIAKLAAPAHRATRAHARRPIGRAEGQFHSYFALLAPSPPVRLIARAQAEHVARMLKGGPHADLPLVSAAAPFHAGGRAGPDSYCHVPAGPVALRHAFDLYPYPNTIAALLVTGLDLALWLERSMSLFHQIAPGARDAPLIDPTFPPFNFDVIEGLTWQVDLSAPPRTDANGHLLNPDSRRIRNLCHQGRPIDPDARFVLATNSYRAAGSGGFPGASPDNIILSGPDTSRDVVVAHIRRAGALLPDRAPNWRLSAPRGTTALFDSAPAAADVLTDLAPHRAEPLDLTPEGFRRFRLHL